MKQTILKIMFFVLLVCCIGLAVAKAIPSEEEIYIRISEMPIEVVVVEVWGNFTEVSGNFTVDEVVNFSSEVPLTMHFAYECHGTIENISYEEYEYKNVTVRIIENTTIDWKYLLTKVDEKHLEGLNMIVLHPEDKFYEEIGDNKFCISDWADGMYDDDNRIIYLYNVSEYKGEFNVPFPVDVYIEDLLIHTFRHEVGHHIWYNHLNQRHRHEWCELFGKQKKFLTDYSSWPCDENFPEEYAIYQYEPSTLPRAKRKLMKKILKEIR